ncbi:hypothetical protein [Sodalinema gerasimenkoae]|uniref:hypothetical protein n=1 Tax=Sodalinema gerasimenkoae TaxID=2862348 RepID=UPI001359D087|nr:hypothetical protein [Sodalinema gerasimenkoae]
MQPPSDLTLRVTPDEFAAIAPTPMNLPVWIVQVVRGRSRSVPEGFSLRSINANPPN